VGLSKISVEYSRPAAKGREIFGGLVPFGRIWRVGANKSTKIKVDKEMEVLGNTLPKGTYALYAFPEKEVWQIVFHTNTAHWGDGRKNYISDEDLFRVNVKPQKIPYHQENLLIAFDSISHNAVNLNLIWANTKVVVPFKVDTQTQMEQEITTQIEENPTAQTYYEAARYLQEQEKDYVRALGYVDKALELGGDTYYFYRVKSLLQAHLGEISAAIKSAEKSLIIASELEKDEFVRMNEDNIKKWKTLLENN
jgi:tetratricopeptide (TPR) repeat protein